MWKQPKCPSTDDWLKMWFIYAMETYSAIKKNDILPFVATWTDLENIILSEVSQPDKDKYHMISLTCRIFKIIQMNLYTKQKETRRHRKQTYGYQRGKGGGRDKLGVWD